MSDSFFFYDLETSGFSARSDRIMQFAGIRTDMALNPIGEPFNILVKLAADVLPSPEAVLLTGITPQQTLSEGVSEAEFLKTFQAEVVQPGTIFTGFNSIRFDDEFMRFTLYRNFYDAYEWEWKNNCSRWDILDMVRMTRALRPDGIEWPFTEDGKPANRLELLTAANKIEHIGAHDALADVKATIAVAKLIKNKQPKLFSYLLSIRNKKQVAPIVESNEPFIYTSGRISPEYLNTSPFVNLAKSSDAGSAVVYDLRFDPEELIDLSVDELIDKWKYVTGQPSPDKPFKTIKYNHAPAISPMGVLDAASLKRLSISLEEVKKNLAKLNKIKPDFSKKISEVITAMDDNRDKEIKAKQSDAPYNPDNMLYDGFFSDGDKRYLEQIHNANPDQINEAGKNLKDRRLIELLPLYKARNYPKSLSGEEMETWEYYCSEKLTGGNESSPLAYYFAKLDELAQKEMTKAQSFLIEELKLYGQSLIP